MSSGSLKTFLKKSGKVPKPVIKLWSKQILEGLDYLHSHNPPIIHRDIKLDNIFIGGTSGIVKIGDMGLARNVTKAPMTCTGTPQFMAPDYFLGGEYNESVDIWAFGMCLIEMVTLDYPYYEYEQHYQIYKALSENVMPRSLAKIIDEDIVVFIAYCLDIPEKRLTCKQLLKQPFLIEHDESTPSLRTEVEVDEFLSDEFSWKEHLESLIKSYSTGNDTDSIDILRRSDSNDILIKYNDRSSEEDNLSQGSSGDLIEIKFMLEVSSIDFKKQIKFKYDKHNDTPEKIARELASHLSLDETIEKKISIHIEQHITKKINGMVSVENDSSDIVQETTSVSSEQISSDYVPSSSVEEQNEELPSISVNETNDSLYVPPRSASIDINLGVREPDGKRNLSSSNEILLSDLFNKNIKELAGKPEEELNILEYYDDNKLVELDDF
eukprot:TRINITY_DN698_c0_g1_i1.p1 TRINITY_DN698_c0_g1~~TRINITY_DN698_c0_g1_i1.p1  ORF type:complete len:439 (-),score=100.13 TRINITY_DN698_c0_g1_i1:188-1504(-)